MTTSLARDEALAFAARADSDQSEINDLHDDPHAPDRARRIARLHADLGLCLKLAEVHALLFIGEQLDRLPPSPADPPSVAPGLWPTPYPIPDDYGTRTYNRVGSPVDEALG